MTIKFKDPVKHGVPVHNEFLPGIPLAFEDPDTEPYFIGAGWAETTNENPLKTYSQDEVSVEPDTTRHSESGLMMREILDADGDIEKAKATRSAKAKSDAEALAAEEKKGQLQPADVNTTSGGADTSPGKTK
jgi:hypothetical protein